MISLLHLNLLVVLLAAGVWAAVYILRARGSLPAKQRLAMLSVHVSMFASILAVVSLEGATTRYGSDGYLTTYIPAHWLQNVANLAQLGIVLSAAGALLARFAGPSTRSLMARWHSRIWLPYLGAWALGTVLGRYVGTSSSAWTSVAALLPVGLLSVGSPAALVRTAFVGLRSIVAISLALALVAPSRVWAPSGAWPGGWRAEMPRLQGIFPQPNTLGWIAAVAILLELRGPRSKLRYPALGLAALALALSGSRSPIAALIIAVVVVNYRGSAHSAKWGRTSWGRRGAILVATTVVVGQVLRTATNLGSINGRTQTWTDAWAVFTSSPLTGSGPGGYLTADTFRNAVPYAHNQILHTAAELGVVGLFALLVHVVALVKVVRLSARRQLLGSAAVLWLVMFASENLLRFTELGFTLQVLAFAFLVQVALTADPHEPVGRHPERRGSSHVATSTAAPIGACRTHLQPASRYWGGE